LIIDTKLIIVRC